jgi:hypothetical protein
MLIAEWMHLYCGASLQNIIIPDRTLYSVLEIFSLFRSEAWLNLFWKYINCKLFAV